MPRLLNVNNYHYRRGGAEVVYLGHGTMFANAGWATDWFSMKHPNNPVGTEEEYFAELIDLEYMQGKFDRAQAAAAVIYNGDARRQMRRLLADRRPDVAHLHNIYHHLSPSILGELKRAAVPVVLTAHDLKLACPSYKMLTHDGICERCRGGRIWNVAVHKCLKGSRALSGLIALESAAHRLFRLYSANIDRIVAPSVFYRNKLISWGWPAEQIVYIPNFSPVRWESTPVPEVGSILYFGRLSEEKGIATLIRASAASHVPVVIAGTGPEEASFRRLAQDLSAPVEFAGYRTGTELAALLRGARAVVLPSEWYENSPMSVLEAYSAGRPVLGANIGGIPELILHGETGWTFASGDVEALAARMAAVFAMSAVELSAMARVGSRMAQDKFSEARYLDNMSSLYAELGVTKA